MSISFPTVSQLHGNERVESLSTTYDFSRACFAVNVTASDIPTRVNSTCDVPTGIFVGFVKPGATLTLSVPNGSARKLEIIAFKRSSSADPCPENRANLAGLGLSRLARVGLVSSFDALQPEVTLDVTLSSPTGTLASQYAMPVSCAPKVAPSLFSANFTSGRAVQSGTKYKAVSSVSGAKNELTVQGGNYRARLSRRAQ